MATSIRLQRTGRKKQASFRIVVTDVNEQRDGPSIETLGTYNPRTKPSIVRLDAAASLNWLYEGAQPTNTVISIFRKAGVWQKFQAGETADSLDERVVTLGPQPGDQKTSRRAAVAAEAQKLRAVEVAAAKQAAEAEAKQTAKEAAKQAEEEAKAEAEAVAAEAEESVEALEETAEAEAVEAAVEEADAALEEATEAVVETAEAVVEVAAEAEESVEEEAGAAVEEEAEEIAAAAEEASGEEAEKQD